MQCYSLSSKQMSRSFPFCLPGSVVCRNVQLRVLLYHPSCMQYWQQMFMTVPLQELGACCRAPQALSWFLLRFLFGPGNASLQHLHSRFPGLSPLMTTLLMVSRAIDSVYSYYIDTPLRLLVPRILFHCAVLLLVLAPVVAVAAFRARAAWRLCFMDMRLTEQASVTDPRNFSLDHGLAMQFGERMLDLVRDFTADNNCRAAAAAECAVYALLAVFTPLWLLLLPPAQAAVAVFGLLIVLAVFGILSLHWWAEVALDSLSLATSHSSNNRSDPHGGDESQEAAGTAVAAPYSTSALDGTIIAACLINSVAAQLFFGSGHFCEFSGLQWTAAFVGFDDSVTWRSGLLVAINTFAPHVLAVLLLLLVVTSEIQAQMTLLDSAAADGHELQRPKRVPRTLVNNPLPASETLPSAGASPASWLTSPDEVNRWLQPLASANSWLQPTRGFRQQPASSAGAPASMLGSTTGRTSHRTPNTTAHTSRIAGSHEQPYSGAGGAMHEALQSAVSAFATQVLRVSGLHSLSSGYQTASRAPLAGDMMFDPSWSPQQWHSGECVHALLASVVGLKLAMLSLELFCASFNAFIQRRHLMIWALFAPKWMFEVCFWFVGVLSLLLVASISDILVHHVLPSK
jgi:hypothetical protein